VSAVSVRDLRKSYGQQEAVSGITFEIEVGEVFGLLGPNGAGKTTTVEILEGYRRRDGGTVEVLGTDPERAGLDWRERIGVVLQQSQTWATLTVAETLRIFAGYYREPRSVDEVIAVDDGGQAGHARKSSRAMPADGKPGSRPVNATATLEQYG